MRVSPPEAKRAYSCTRRIAMDRPRSQRCLDAHRKVGKRNIRIGFVKMEARWYHPVLERERDLDEASNTCRRFEMPDIGFHRTDAAGVFGKPVSSKHISQRRYLNWVP